jgi:hypothetical protein
MRTVWMRPSTTSIESTSKTSPAGVQRIRPGWPLTSTSSTAKSPISRREEALEQLVPQRAVGLEPRLVGLQVLARPRDELAAAGLAVADHRGDPRIVVVEHVAQQERGALGRRELLEHDQERLRERVGELGVVLRRRGGFLHERVGQPRPTYVSRRTRASRRWSIAGRVDTVVIHAAGSSTSASARVKRSSASCTTSSVSATLPSIR